MDLKKLSEEEKKEKASSLLSKLLPQFKHPGFQDEQEWRIVVQQEKVTPSVSFRAGANVIVPYIKLNISLKEKLPISYVRVGPGREQELTKRSIELFLRSRGYENIEVKLSSVPFRS